MLILHFSKLGIWDSSWGRGFRFCWLNRFEDLHSKPSVETAALSFGTMLTGFQTGSGQAGFAQKGDKVTTRCHLLFVKCALVATFRQMLPQFAIVRHMLLTLPRENSSYMGNCGTATTPFVLSLYGSCRDTNIYIYIYIYIHIHIHIVYIYIYIYDYISIYLSIKYIYIPSVRHPPQPRLPDAAGPSAAELPWRPHR